MMDGNVPKTLKSVIWQVITMDNNNNNDDDDSIFSIKQEGPLRVRRTPC